MGLDMFLTSKDNNGKEEEYAYWRKANQINKWFDNIFNGVENLKQYKVNRSILENLLKECKNVKILLNKIHKSNSVEEKEFLYNDIYNIMPPMSGFFFGSCKINEQYENNINSTIEQLEIILKFYDFKHNILYYNIWY